MDERSEALLTLAMDLPESARAEIAVALIHSLDPEPDADVEQAWREEIARRMAAFEAGEDASVPWEQVREKLYARLNERRAG
jgi:putative addiction module component (TIGR02574 family)